MFEKKRGTRFLASVMALVMLLSLAPVGALAAKGSNDNESYDTQDTFNIEGVETYYPLSGESNNNFTEARYIWEKDNTVYLAFTVSNGQGDGTGNSYPIQSAKASGNNLSVDRTLYKYLKFGSGDPILAEGKNKKDTRWQIATYEESIQSLLNTGNTLTISADTGAGGYDLDRVEYTVKDYPIPGEPGEGGGIPGGSDGDGDQQEAKERLYIAIIKGDPANLTLPQEPGFSTSYGYYFVQNYEGTYSLTEWSNNGPVFSDNAGSYVNVGAFNNATKAATTNNNGGRVTGIFAEDGINLDTYFSTTISEENIIRAYLNERGITGNAGDYTLVPYVLKYEDYSSDGYDGYYTPAHGYHLDCYIIKNDNVKVTYNANLNGATTEYTVPADISVAKNTPVTISKWTQGEQAVNDSVVTATKDGKIYEFKGWSATQSEPAEGSILHALGTLQVTENTTLYAIWKEKKEEKPNPNPPTDPGTDLVDAMYFVLLPGQGVPSSGVSQGVDKYFPNASNNGGVTGKSNTTGYEGKITKAATELTGANTSDGYFNGNGVGDQYLADIGDLGYFNGSNYTNGKYNGTLPDGLKDFNMTNKEIVWYVIKKEDNDYHVDGYVKGVPIQLNYYDGFNGQKIFNTENLQSGNSVTIKSLPNNVTHEGWKFVGWFTKDGKKYEVDSSHTLIDSLNLYARWEKSYEVVTHFMDENGTEKENRTNSHLEGVHGTPLKDMVLPLNKVDMNGISGNYVYVPSETSYSVDKVDKGKVGDATYTEANTVIHQYYYLDETGNLGEDEKGNPTDKKDGIPDAWQYKVTFQVVNGNWNVSKNNKNIVVYVNAKNQAGEVLDSKLTASQIPAVGSEPNSGYEASGSWDKTLSDGLVINADTTFTFTYSKRSSSGGSSRPSTPTVTIPDDVPTGLNGKDHYAYIIGYGNNDVRPQNNITRAEVATIFFRLLTDETREANMTKSNGYNDVKDGDWFCCAVSTLSKMGIIKGYEDGSFKPDQKITRAETMTLVNRVLNRLPEAKDDLHKDMKTWVDNMDETAWYYLAVQEATNSHYFKNKTGTKFEQWTDLRDTRDWSELEK